MDTRKTPGEISHDRRRFFGAAALTVAAAQLGVTGCAKAPSSGTKPAGPSTVKPGTNACIYSAGVGVAGRDPDHGRVVIGAGVAGVSR